MGKEFSFSGKTGNAQMLDAAFDAKSDLIAEAKSMQAALRAVTFYDEWQEELFPPEELSEQSLTSRQDELDREIGDNPSVMADSARLDRALSILAACQDLMGDTSGLQGDGVQGYLTDWSYAEALGLDEEQYADLKQKAIWASSEGDISEQDAVTQILLPSVERAISELEQTTESLSAAVDKARRLAPQNPQHS